MNGSSQWGNISTEFRFNRFLEALAVLAVVVEPGRSFSLTLTLTTGEDG